MKRIPYKVRLWLGIGLMLWAMVAIIVIIILAAYSTPIWLLITIPIISAILFIIGVVLVPKNADDNVSNETKSKQEINKPKKHKIKKEREPFISEKEWEELEEEDEEVMYIEEED